MIELEAVSKHFGRVAAVRALSLRVEPAGTTALVGPSGVGKTTVMRLVAGLELPDAGTVRLAGRVVSRPGWGEAPHRRGIGFVFQSPALWPHLSVRANVSFALAGRDQGRAAARRAADAILERVGALHLAERRPDQLSGGEARRVALARALAPRPRILLLDEPLSNLDPAARHQLAALIVEVAGETGATVLVVTHQADEVALLGAARVDLVAAAS